jgi:hypothetical protein
MKLLISLVLATMVLSQASYANLTMKYNNTLVKNLYDEGYALQVKVQSKKGYVFQKGQQSVAFPVKDVTKTFWKLTDGDFGWGTVWDNKGFKGGCIVELKKPAKKNLILSNKKKINLTSIKRRIQATGPVRGNDNGYFFYYANNYLYASEDSPIKSINIKYETIMRTPNHRSQLLKKVRRKGGFETNKPFVGVKVKHLRNICPGFTFKVVEINYEEL